MILIVKKKSLKEGKRKGEKRDKNNIYWKRGRNNMFKVFEDYMT